MQDFFHRTAVVTSLAFLGMTASAADATSGIEEALAAAQQAKRGITLYVNGQTVVGAVVRVVPDTLVEMRSQEFGRIIVRLDRIDGVALP